MAFSKRLVDHWWEFILSGDVTSASFVRLEPDPSTCTVRLRGNGYAADGTLSSVWESLGAILHPAERRICYTWKGWIPLRPNETFEGYGDIVFAESRNGIQAGSGSFFDINLTKLAETGRKTFRLERCTAEDVDCMESASPARIAAYTRDKVMTA